MVPRFTDGVFRTVEFTGDNPSKIEPNDLLADEDEDEDEDDDDDDDDDDDESCGVIVVTFH